MNILKVGDKAPQFTLQNQVDEAVSLSQFTGKKSVSLFLPQSSHSGLYYTGVWVA